MPVLTPISRISPIFEMPCPYMMSNSTCLNGGATLFLTTFTRVVLPTISSPFLLWPVRRMSSRTEASNLSALPPVEVSGLLYITPIFMRSWLMKITMISEQHTSELQVTNAHLVCRLLLDKQHKKKNNSQNTI